MVAFRRGADNLLLYFKASQFILFVSSARRAVFAVSVGASILTISGCGGDGGGSGSGGGTATNRAPQIDSAASATLTENSTAAVLALAASDPDGGAVTFAISGGADAAAFQVAGPNLQFR